jgi:hypothetical protein
VAGSLDCVHGVRVGPGWLASRLGGVCLGFSSACISLCDFVSD